MIDLTDNSITNVPLLPSSENRPMSITFDATGKRVFTANENSDSVSIIDDLPKLSKICQASGCGTGDIRTFESNGQPFLQITCVNFVGECSGEIE